MMDLQIKECFKHNFTFLSEYLALNKSSQYDNSLKTFIKSENKQLFILEYLDNSESAIEQHRSDMIFIYASIVNYYYSLGKYDEISKYFPVSIYLKSLLFNINFYLKKIEGFQMGKDYEDYRLLDHNLLMYFRLNSLIKLNFIIVFSILLFSKRTEIVNFLNSSLI